MKGLSGDIEIAIQDSIEALKFEAKILGVPDDKMKRAVSSKVSSFISTKQLLDKWVNGPNAPSEEKIRHYSKELVDGGMAAGLLMRHALRKQVDWGKLEPEKHAAAVEAKPFILDSIHTLNAGVVELRLKLESDNLTFKDKEFKVGYPERVGSGELFPIDELHTQWYNRKKDAVKICPNGTEGEIRTLWGLKVQLPAVPENEEDILFSDLPIDEQYWRRQEPPKGLSMDTMDQHVDYIVEEFRRRNYGVWFMNRGKPVYLTGHAYFWLQWYRDIDNGGYSNFRYAQNDLAYHTKACEVDPRCLGQVFGKSRRTGFTLEKLSRKLNLETMRKNFRSGLTSKSGKDAREAFDKKQYAYASLPFFFKPVVRGKEDSSNEIFFAKPSDKSKEAKKRKDDDNNDYLNTRSDWRNTTNDAYDSTKLNDYLGDEYAKWERPYNYLLHWKKISPTMDENGIIVGKAWLGSTFESRDKGGREGKILFDGSDPEQRNKVTGRTRTGLYRYFMSVDENSAKHTDKYGVCHKRKPKEELLNQNNEVIDTGSKEYYDALELEAKKGTQEDYYEHKRNHPRDLKDMFRNKVDHSTFNLEKIAEQTDYNDILRVDEGTKVIRGNFSWKGGVMDTEVIWTPDPNGRFWVTWLPPSEYRNKFTWIRGQRAPENTWLGAGGLDPFGKDKTQDGRGSKGSFHFINRPNAMFPETSRMFTLEYIHRPPSRALFYEDALMAAVFYGIPIFYENDKSGIEDYFERRGYLEYLMLRPAHFDSRNNKKVEERGAPSRSIMIKAIYYALDDYVNNEIGELKDGTMGNMYFNRTLEDWEKFEPDNRTAYDASISSGYALCAIQKPVKEIKDVKIEVDVAPWRTFNPGSGKTNGRPARGNPFLRKR